jgi:hypothetical protein
MKCSICKQESSCLLNLELTSEGEDRIELVCDTCWDIIAAIARRVAMTVVRLYKEIPPCTSNPTQVKGVSDV